MVPSFRHHRFGRGPMAAILVVALLTPHASLAQGANPSPRPGSTPTTAAPVKRTGLLRVTLDNVIADVAVMPQAERPASPEALAALEADERELAAIAIREERRLDRQRSRERALDLERRYKAAVSRGDLDAARRIQVEQDRHADATLDLFLATDEERVAEDRRQALRDAIVAETIVAARDEARTIVDADFAQDAKEFITTGTKYVSVGSGMQQATQASTRLADFQVAFSEAKERRLRARLENPNTSSEEREIIGDLLRLSRAQKAAAEEQLRSNANLTAAGYAIDGALLATAGVGHALRAAKAGTSVVVGEVAATSAVAAETQLAKTFVTNATASGAVDAGVQMYRTGTIDPAEAARAAIAGGIAGTAVSAGLNRVMPVPATTRPMAPADPSLPSPSPGPKPGEAAMNVHTDTIAMPGRGPRQGMASLPAASRAPAAPASSNSAGDYQVDLTAPDAAAAMDRQIAILRSQPPVEPSNASSNLFRRPEFKNLPDRTPAESIDLEPYMSAAERAETSTSRMTTAERAAASQRVDPKSETVALPAATAPRPAPVRATAPRSPASAKPASKQSEPSAAAPADSIAAKPAAAPPPTPAERRAGDAARRLTSGKPEPSRLPANAPASRPTKTAENSADQVFEEATTVVPSIPRAKPTVDPFAEDTIVLSPEQAAKVGQPRPRIVYPSKDVPQPKPFPSAGAKKPAPREPNVDEFDVARDDVASVRSTMPKTAWSPAGPRRGGKYENLGLDLGPEYAALDAKRGVPIFTAEQLEACRVVAREGRLVYAKTGRAVTTETGQDLLYVMDTDGNVFVHAQTDVMAIQHSSLAGGKRPAAAGMLAVENGRVTLMSEWSGHYRAAQPTGRVRVAAAELRNQGVDMAEAVLDPFEK